MDTREELMKLANKALIEKIKERKAVGEIMTYSGKSKPDLVDTLLGTYVKNASARLGMSSAEIRKLKVDLMKYNNKELIEMIKGLKAAGKNVTHSGKKKNELVATIVAVVKAAKTSEPAQETPAIEE